MSLARQYGFLWICDAGTNILIVVKQESDQYLEHVTAPWGSTVVGSPAGSGH